MPKLLIIILLFAGTSFFFTTLAQNPIETAQKNLSNQFTKYRNSHEKYVTAKSAYETYQTALAKNDAFQATKEYLNDIDILYIAYIQLVSVYGDTINWENHLGDQNNATQILTTETNFFENHKQTIANTKNLEELPNVAINAKDHINANTTLDTNKLFANYLIVDAESFLGEFIYLSNTLESHAVENLPEEYNSFFENWKTEIDNIENETKSHLDKAREDYERFAGRFDHSSLVKVSTNTQNAKKTLEKTKKIFNEMLRIL